MRKHTTRKKEGPRIHDLKRRGERTESSNYHKGGENGVMGGGGLIGVFLVINLEDGAKRGGNTALTGTSEPRKTKEPHQQVAKTQRKNVGKKQ